MLLSVVDFARINGSACFLFLCSGFQLENSCFQDEISNFNMASVRNTIIYYYNGVWSLFLFEHSLLEPSCGDSQP